MKKPLIEPFISSISVSNEDRQQLQQLQQSLGLREKVINIIEAQVTSSYEQKLKQYEEAFNRAIHQQYPLADRDYQQLLKLQEILEIKEEVRKKIVAKVIQVYEQKLKQYEEEFTKAIHQQYPLSQDSSNELQLLQQKLGLSNKIVAAIETRNTAPMQAERQRKSQQYEKAFTRAIHRQPLSDDERKVLESFSDNEREVLENYQQVLNLSKEIAQAIEEQVTQVYEQKLQQYEEAFTKAIYQQYPLSDEERQPLQLLQQSLQLRNEIAESIATKVTFFYEQKLQQYDKALTWASQRQYPFSDEDREFLKYRRQQLNLNNNIANLIEAKITETYKQTLPEPKFPQILTAGSALLLALALGTFVAPQLWQSPAPQVSHAPQSKSPLHQLSLAKTLSGNASPVWSAVLSHDGQTLISGGEDQNPAGQFYPIKVWDLNSGQVLRTLNGHRKPIRSLSLSENGQILASSSADNTIKIWNRTTGKLLQTLEGHTEPVWSVALSRDGQTAISGSADKTVRIWNLQTGESRVLSEHTATVYAVALNPNGKTIASSSEDKTIRLWDIATGELIRTLGEPEGHQNVVRAVAFSSNGKLLVSAGWDGFVKLWDSTTGQLLKTFAGHSNRVVSATFINERAIASASLDNTIRLWDAQTGQPLQTIPAHSNWVLSVTAQLATQTLISSSKDTTIKIWR